MKPTKKKGPSELWLEMADRTVRRKKRRLELLGPMHRVRAVLSIPLEALSTQALQRIRKLDRRIVSSLDLRAESWQDDLWDSPGAPAVAVFVSVSADVVNLSAHRTDPDSNVKVHTRRSLLMRGLELALAGKLEGLLNKKKYRGVRWSPLLA